MNIFDELTGLFGEPKEGELKGISSDFWNTAREIREKMGENAYVLDSYLYEIFSALDSIIVTNVTDEAENVINKVYFLCKNIVEYEPVKSKDSFYELAHNYIISHPLPYKESETRFKLYIALLMDDFTDMFIEKIYREIHNITFTAYNHDTVKENFEKIRNVVGTEKIKALNDLIEKRFTIPTIIDIFKRTVTRELFSYLLFQDKQTSKRVFQLILENKNSL